MALKPNRPGGLSWTRHGVGLCGRERVAMPMWGQISLCEYKINWATIMSESHLPSMHQQSTGMRSRGQQHLPQERQSAPALTGSRVPDWGFPHHQGNSALPESPSCRGWLCRRHGHLPLRPCSIPHSSSAISNHFNPPPYCPAHEPCWRSSTPRWGAAGPKCNVHCIV